MPRGKVYYFLAVVGLLGSPRALAELFEINECKFRIIRDHASAPLGLRADPADLGREDAVARTLGMSGSGGSVHFVDSLGTALNYYHANQSLGLRYLFMTCDRANEYTDAREYSVAFAQQSQYQRGGWREYLLTRGEVSESNSCILPVKDVVQRLRTLVYFADYYANKTEPELFIFHCNDQITLNINPQKPAEKYMPNSHGDYDDALADEYDFDSEAPNAAIFFPVAPTPASVREIGERTQAAEHRKKYLEQVKLRVAALASPNDEALTIILDYLRTAFKKGISSSYEDELVLLNAIPMLIDYFDDGRALRLHTRDDILQLHNLQGDLEQLSIPQLFHVHNALGSLHGSAQRLEEECEAANSKLKSLLSLAFANVCFVPRLRSEANNLSLLKEAAKVAKHYAHMRRKARLPSRPPAERIELMRQARLRQVHDMARLSWQAAPTSSDLTRRGRPRLSVKSTKLGKDPLEVVSRRGKVAYNRLVEKRRSEGKNQENPTPPDHAHKPQVRHF